MSKVLKTNWQRTQKLPQQRSSSSHQSDVGHSLTQSKKAPTMDPFYYVTTSQREPEAAHLQASAGEGLHATFTSRRTHWKKKKQAADWKKLQHPCAGYKKDTFMALKWEMMEEELMLGQMGSCDVRKVVFRDVNQVCKWDQTVSGYTVGRQCNVCLKIVQTDSKNLLGCNYFHLSDV